MKTALISALACMITCVFGGETPRDARILKVDALVTPPPDHRPPDDPRRLLERRQEALDDEECGGMVSLEDVQAGQSVVLDAPVFRRNTTVLDTDELAALIPTFIAEDSWTNERNSLDVHGGKFTVIQTPEVLAEIEAFLQALYHRASRRYDVVCALVPPAVLDAALQAAGVSPNAAHFPAAVLEQALAQAGDAGWSWRSTARDCASLAVTPVAQRLTLKDYDVNQTGAEPVVNPLVGLLRNGPAVWLRIAPTPIPDRLFLDLKCAQEATPEPGAPRRISLGDLELAAAGGSSTTTALLIPPGSVVRASELRWPRQDLPAYALLVRVTPVPQPPPPQSPATALEIGTYCELVRARRAKPKAESAGMEEESTIPSDFAATARRWLPADLANDPRLRLQVAGGALFVAMLGDAAATSRAAALLSAALQERFRSRVQSVEAWALRGSVAKEVYENLREEGGVLLVKDWRERAGLAQATGIRLTGLCGRRLSMFAAMGRWYVADIETVSGGENNVILEVPDPLIAWAGTGLDLAITVQPVAGTSWMQVDLRGEVFATTFGRTSAMRVDHTVRLGGELGFEALGQKMDVDLPDQKVNNFAHVVTIPAGRTAFLNAVPDPQDPARVIILAVEARVLD